MAELPPRPASEPLTSTSPVIRRGDSIVALSLSEVSIRLIFPEVCDNPSGRGYTAAYVGKWHLAGAARPVPSPNDRGGFDDFWEGSNVLERTSHPYEGSIWDGAGREIRFAMVEPVRRYASRRCCLYSVAPHGHPKHRSHAHRAAARDPCYSGSDRVLTEHSRSLDRRTDGKDADGKSHGERMTACEWPTAFVLPRMSILP
jgi:hypothetical protein